MRSDYSKLREAFFLFFWLILISLIFKYMYTQGMIINGDSYFHAERVFEIRYAFLHHELPNWLNFHTFLGVGQAVNGLYPDITLWPLVFLTLPFSLEHQIFLINLFILLAIVLVTSISVKQHYNLKLFSSLLVGTIYGLSGHSIYCFMNEFQPGTAIIYIFSFPIFFTIVKTLRSRKINFKLSLELTLCITLVMYSHLLSVIVISFIVLIIMIFMLLLQKARFASLVNVFIAFLFSIPATLPIIYRYVKISKSDVLPPFGQGNIQAESLSNFIQSVSWGGHDGLAIISIIIFIIIFAWLQKKNAKRIIPYVIVELLIIILCTNLFPWKLFNQVPFLNNIQYANWRFGIWLSIIPIIMLIVFFKKKGLLNKILYILSILSLGMFISIFRTDIQSASNRLTRPIITQLTTIKAHYTGADIDLLSIPEKPDYFPNVSNVVNSHYYISRPRQRYLYNQKILYNKGKINLYKKDINNGIVIYPYLNKTIDNTFQLPLLGYKSLKYSVEYNGKRVDYEINREGYLELKSVKLKPNSSIKIVFHNPSSYTYLVIFSLIFTIICILILVYKIKLKMKWPFMMDFLVTSKQKITNNLSS